MMALPDELLYIMEQIETVGGEVFLVGGCVRDLLLNRPIHDWDLCTSLRPDALVSLFPKTIPTGIRHGTVTVLHHSIPFEITTYRTESDYSDHRKPDRVCFASSLEEDLSRRDFTVNAMAMDRSGRITDLFGGREDLAAGLIRCVGDPTVRYREDALRMLRCVRFSAQLGFEIESETFHAIAACRELCRWLSAERVRDEAEKILCSPAPGKLRLLTELGILDRFGLRGGVDYSAVSHAPADRISRWVMLSILQPSADLGSLRLEKKLLRLSEAVKACRSQITDTRSVKKAVYLYGFDAVRLYADLMDDTNTEAILTSGECMCLRELAVSGADFPEIRGEALGNLLRTLLEYVWDHPEENRKEALMAAAAAALGTRSEYTE